MKPIKFKEANVVFYKDKPGYMPMYAFKTSDAEGYIVSCWNLSISERIRVLFTGKIWINSMMYHNPITAIFMSTKKSQIFMTPKCLQVLRAGLIHIYGKIKTPVVLLKNKAIVQVCQFALFLIGGFKPRSYITSIVYACLWSITMLSASIGIVSLIKFIIAHVTV